MFGICQFPLHLSGILPFTFFNFALYVNLLLKIPDILEMFVKIPKKVFTAFSWCGCPGAGYVAALGRVRSVHLNLSVQRSHMFSHSPIKKPPKNHPNAPFGQLQRPSIPFVGLILYPTRGKQSKSNQKAISGGFNESVCSGFGYWLLEPENGDGS
ncbi:hypothetical protein [Aeromonas sanarellii]|uniref:hypothetical protein n=1 Tax=Aeromonas sanarellii TaxID=633415 RepID=UPI0036D6548D